jgi:sporulation protein YlmC with PRC-barrel domain
MRGSTWETKMKVRSAAKSVAVIGALALALPALAAAQQEQQRGERVDRQQQHQHQQHGEKAVRQIEANQFQVDKLAGTDIKNQDGDTIGTVDDVLLDKDGRVAAVIVSTGGVLGIGEKTVALNWDQVEVTRDQDDPDKLRVRVAMSEDELENLPEFDADISRTMAQRQPEQRQAEQRQQQPQRAQEQRRQPAGEALTALGAQQFKLDRLVGTDVINQAGDDVGTVDDVVLERDGRVAAVIITTGGVLGIGARTVALPWDRLDVSRDQDDPEKYRVRTAMTEDELENLPEFDADARAERR